MASAQRATPLLRAAPRSEWTNGYAPSREAAWPVAQSSATTRRGRNVAVGAAIGAVGGAVVAAAATGGLQNHENDFLAYLIYVPLGAVIGAFVGVISD